MPLILRRMPTLLPSVLLLTVLGGCGQKGDLYLPPPPPATRAPASQTVPVPAPAPSAPAQAE